MKVTIKLHDYLKTKVKDVLPDQSSLELSLPEGTKVETLLEILKLEEEWVGLVILNGSQVDRQTTLSHRDELELFAPLSGG